MAGGYTAAARFLRTTLISGNVYKQQTTAGAAANNTTINSYALAGTIVTIRFKPTTTQTVATAVPAAPSTAGDMGWRDDVAEDAANQITWDAANWTVRLRMLCSNTANSQECLTTVIVYRKSGAGSTEIGRGTDQRTLTNTIATVSITVAAAAALVFAAGDTIQVEVYTTTMTLGVAAAPATATTITCRIEESDANSGAKIAPATYTKQFVRSTTTAITLAGAASRLIAANRSFTSTISLASVVQKRVSTTKTTTITLATVVQKTIIPNAKTTPIALATAIQKRVSTTKATAITLAATSARTIAAARSFTTPITLGTAFARSVNSARSFATAITLTSTGSVQITFTILGRLSGTLTLSRGEVY